MSIFSFNWTYLALITLVMLSLHGCSRQTTDEEKGAERNTNILLQEWETPFGMPPFAGIPSDAFVEAYDAAADLQNSAIQAIVANTEEPTFENTIETYERSRNTLYRVLRAFIPVSQYATDDVINEASSYIYPAFAAHEEKIFLNREIFERVDHLYQNRDAMELRDDQVRLIEMVHQEFVKYGVAVAEEKKPRLEEVSAKIAGLGQLFRENLRNEVNAFDLVVENQEALGDMPINIVNVAAERAVERGHDCACWSFDLSRSIVESFLRYVKDRDLREQMLNAYRNLGNGDNEWNTTAIANEILELRAERASIMGYENFSEFQTKHAMAQTPENVRDLIMALWKPALEKAKVEQAALQARMNKDGVAGELKAWDWPYYAEIVRKEQFDVSEDILRPYFSVEAVRDGSFDLAYRLFGLRFEERPDYPRWDEAQQVFEVLDENGEHLGIVMLDFYARDNKQVGAGGARTDEIRVAEKMDRPISAIAANTYAYPGPTEDTPALLSQFEAKTVFHEFGHALHTLLSTQTYVRLSGSNYLPRDGAEFPSQALEYWFKTPSYMRSFAKHYKTGEPISKELVATMERSSGFNVGYEAVQLAAASLLDLEMHSIGADEDVDVMAIQGEFFDELGLPEEVGSRYYAPHFQHVISGSYPSSYYGYTWANVLAADAFGAFEETSLFDEETAKRFKALIFEIGAAEPQLKMFTEFRGREPTPDALMKSMTLGE